MNEKNSREITAFLESYGFCSRWLEASENERRLRGRADTALTGSELGVKMFRVRRFIMSMPDTDEKCLYTTIIYAAKAWKAVTKSCRSRQEIFTV